MRNGFEYQKRRDNPRGRALQHDISALGLLQGDRLEPSQNLQDVADWDDVDQAEFPVTVTFWRRGAETRARRRLPIIGPELGIPSTLFVWSPVTRRKADQMDTPRKSTSLLTKQSTQTLTEHADAVENAESQAIEDRRL